METFPREFYVWSVGEEDPRSLVAPRLASPFTLLRKATPVVTFANKLRSSLPEISLLE